MPDLRVINNEFVPLAHIAAASSVQWTPKLYEVGTFEIHTSLDIRGANQLQAGAIVFLNAQRVGIIETATVDEEKGDFPVVAKGKELKNICLRRVTVPSQLHDTQYYGYDRFPALTDPDAPAESVIKHYADAHMVNPEDASRKLSGLVIATDQLRGDAMRWSSRFEPLTTVYKSIGEQTGVGYTIGLDLDNELFVFDVIVGRDRTASSSHPVIFSPEFGNISGLKFSDDISNYYNTGYAGGAGEDEARLIQVVYEDDMALSGWNRSEVWLDCGSIDMVDELLYEGAYKLKDKARVRSLTGDVIQSGPFKYRDDWDLGDYVTIPFKRIGLVTDAQITEVKESYEKGKFSAVPTFGKRNKNILDEIRKIGVVR
jgi:hypothetical protein